MTRATILYVSHTGTWSGGAEKSLLQLLHAARSTGYSPQLVSPPGELVDRIGPLCDAIWVMPVPWLRRSRNPLTLIRLVIASVVMALRFARIVHTSRAAVIHANSGVSALALCLARILCRTALIWHQHDIVPNRRINRMVLGTCGRLASAVVATSGAVAESLFRLGIPKTRIQVLYPRIDDTFRAPPLEKAEARSLLDIPPEAVVMTVIGRMVRRKGQTIFLETAALLARAGVDVHAIVVGEVPDVPDSAGEHSTYLAEVQRLAAVPELRRRVSFLGQRDDVPAVLAASDVLLIPAFAEPFGLVMVEAFVSGVPVVASAGGGPLEIIQHEVTGLLVPPGDSLAAAGAIQRLLDDAGLRTTMIENARRFALEQFSMDRLAIQLDAMYSAVIDHTLSVRYDDEHMSNATGAVGTAVPEPRNQ